MIPWWKTEFGEADIARVSQAIWSRNISQGPVTRELEGRLAQILGVPYVVCTSSGTTALTMGLMAAGIGAGREVIVPNRTWIATAHAVLMTGAKVRLADVDERGLLGETAPGTASIPVHLNGRLAFSSPWSIEDACQGFPKPPFGIMACYSMSTAKLLPTGQGGFVATGDEALYKELKRLRTHDVEDAMVPQELRWKRFGYNFRYNDILASIGLSQLEGLAERIELLQEIHAFYKARLPSYLEMVPRETGDGVPLYVEVLYADSERLRAYLVEHGIEARPNYPSLNTAPYLNDARRFPNSERFEHGLTLPCGPAQTKADLHRVIEVLNCFNP